MTKKYMQREQKSVICQVGLRGELYLIDTPRKVCACERQVGWRAGGLRGCSNFLITLRQSGGRGGSAGLWWEAGGGRWLLQIEGSVVASAGHLSNGLAFQMDNKQSAMPDTFLLFYFYFFSPPFLLLSYFSYFIYRR